ncbi:MAG: pro-sigmaK processing inhibitor BofA family protein [Acutalibacteraceae bacterium]|nr:pro-sigmaK processing inhibitor BofA family protein [Clostridia bacterium]MEE1329732.1 pro-sigmaK processing inhibitor BofA family protein [Acutalibacteraceae bacterium]
MELIKYGGIAIISVGALAVFICALRTHKPFKMLLINALASVLITAIIDLTARYTGVNIPINEWTASGAAVFGIPALIGFVIMPVIFK